MEPEPNPETAETAQTKDIHEDLADGMQYAERWRMIGDLLDDARAIMVNLRDECGWECADEWIKAHESLTPQRDFDKMQGR